MQSISFYIWTLAHIAAAVVVALTAPLFTAILVILILICSQIAVYFNARLDEGVFEESSLDGASNLLRSLYTISPLGVLVLAAIVLYVRMVAA